MMWYNCKLILNRVEILRYKLSQHKISWLHAIRCLLAPLTYITSCIIQFTQYTCVGKFTCRPITCVRDHQSAFLEPFLESSEVFFRPDNRQSVQVRKFQNQITVFSFPLKNKRKSFSNFDLWLNPKSLKSISYVFAYKSFYQHIVDR